MEARSCRGRYTNTRLYTRQHISDMSAYAQRSLGSFVLDLML